MMWIILPYLAKFFASIDRQTNSPNIEWAHLASTLNVLTTDLS